MKRAFSFILVLILLLGMSVPTTAAGTPTLSLSSGEVKAGETVTLTVSIKDNPGIALARVYLYYDTAAFSVDPDADVESTGRFSSGMLLSNTIENAKESGVYDGAAGKDGIMLLWLNSGGSNVTSSGKMFTVTLRANKEIANGEYSIKLDYSSALNEAEASLNLQTEDATLVVSGGSGQKEPEKEEADVVEFSDISGHWAADYIKQSAEIGLVEGYEGKYRPNDTMTRAEFVTILWRSVGEPKPSGKAGFTDLTQDWYKDAVAWAEENNVVNGMGDGKFEPNGQVTREQLVTILHRLAGSPVGTEVMFTGIYDQQYSDSAQIGDWAKSALYWSVYKGIYCGENAEEIGSTLAPKKPANRAQIAVMMIRYLDKQ